MKTIFLVAATVSVFLASQAFGGEFAADAYHEQNCTRCHNSAVYTRENRRVRSYPQLEAQVARCDAMLETKLFPDDLASLVDHLNDSYYRFDKN
jgi:hypothetical protein